MEAIKLNITTSGLKLHKIGVFNVVPPNLGGTQGHDWSGVANPEEIRKCFVEYFNQQLKLKCEECGYWFVDIYDKYTDDKGWLDTNLSDGHMHIRAMWPLVEYLREQLSE